MFLSNAFGIGPFAVEVVDNLVSIFVEDFEVQVEIVFE